MEQEEFYKDLYDRSLDTKDEINNSLSIPIGIITALVAGLFYAVTTFDFADKKIWCLIVFVIIAISSIVFLGISIYRLIKAFSDFHDGLPYAYLADANDLDVYFKGLVNFYAAAGAANPNALQSAQNDFNAYVLSEWIKSTGINQKNNKEKIYQRFQCHQFMIYALVSLSLLVIPFGINFGLSKGKEDVQKVQITSFNPKSITINHIDSCEHINIKSTIMAKQQVQKPTPPPTQMIRDGVNPKPAAGSK
jgi:hypothetical protein